ncbi:hypothetical protein BBJ28_00015065 [Nothophytophthora sp. Chile5]|nr:hypothetical protein BBJ28_00015065 [Nothophytophthora sp. Chile5]
MSGNSSASSPDVGDDEPSANRGDSCSWYANEVCNSPRTCSDCLNVGISGDSCVVGSIGQCVSASEVAGGGAGSFYYPASSRTYCPKTDAACASCRAEWIKEYTQDGYMHSARECEGADGCICLSVCERPNREEVIIASSCSLLANRATRILVVLGMAIGAFLAFTLLAVAVRVIIRRRHLVQRQQEQAERAARVEARRATRLSTRRQLNLKGWSGMRDKLIASDHERLKSKEDSTAEKPTLASTPAPPVIIEEGDGYRPLSPSEHHHQQQRL